MPTTKRTAPNILITGTPGVGKSTMAQKLAEKTGLVWRDVSKLAIDNGCLEEYDEVYKCPVLDEDKDIFGSMDRIDLELISKEGGDHLTLIQAVLRGNSTIFELLDSMEVYMNKGGNIVDYHGADFFPERWFDIVFVLRTSNTILYDRLTARGYLGKKLEDNIDCEIFQTILEEVKSSYKEEIVHELQSNTQQQIEDNVNRVCQWLEQWKKDNQVV